MQQNALLLDDTRAGRRLGRGARNRFSRYTSSYRCPARTVTNSQPFRLQALDSLAAHPFDALAEFGCVLEGTVRLAFIENGFRLRGPDALDTAQCIGISCVDIDGSKRRCHGYSQCERRNKLLDHASLP